MMELKDYDLTPKEAVIDLYNRFDALTQDGYADSTAGFLNIHHENKKKCVEIVLNEIVYAMRSIQIPELDYYIEMRKELKNIKP